MEEHQSAESNQEKRWQALLAMLKERFGKEPNMEAILFLIGINEYKGRMPAYKFSKEQKQDLMHVAVCTLLSPLGFYKLERYDDEGWPLYKQIKEGQPTDLKGQEMLLQQQILDYFE